MRQTRYRFRAGAAVLAAAAFLNHMARPCKTHTFTIHEDAGIPTPDSTNQPSFDDAFKAENGACDAAKEQIEEDEEVVTQDEDKQLSLDLLEGEVDQNADDERRVSAATATSISSYPESVYDAYQDYPSETEKPYTTPIIRPSFRRPQSVQRMRMESPAPFGSRSPRQSILNHSRSRAGTTRSVRSVNARGSPRSRRRIADEQEQEQQHYPLVLLHATLLPVNLPWSMESMQELLPPEVLENLQVLRSRVSETVLQRGILIPHPREEYEMLEERLLEALELKEPRVTKCGHFRGRESTSSSSSGGDTDSGLGSSQDGSDAEACTTCQHYIKSSKSGVGTGSRKWTVKVFAANGLMRSSAWAAAWSEMESVDVEIVPWISGEMRRQLDERTEQEKAEQQETQEDQEARIKEMVEEHVRLAYEETKRTDDVEMRMGQEEAAAKLIVATTDEEAGGIELCQMHQSWAPSLQPPSKDLPEVYRPSQIPLSVLFKNYIYLLSQDRRNVALLFLGLVALFFAVRPTAAPVGQAATPSLNETCALHQASVAPHVVSSDAALEPSGGLEGVTNEVVMEMATSDSDTLLPSDTGSSPSLLEGLEQTVEAFLPEDDVGSFDF